ncbi:MAG TPA: cob(I)yrinic acid a,c-diamide adenosyltransferase [Anaerolineales bacterium]|nr:cob(I)yrinic acid a,c-diamide adenosyltransferase [Anaerolineales bacterium]
MSYYSRRGDDGTTGWLGKGRLKKHDLRIETLGALDEASAALGQARSHALDLRAPALLREAQRDLYQLMAEVSAEPSQAGRFRFEAERVQWLEAQIDTLAAEFPMPREFIVPGDSQGGAAMALARAITRRAERRVVDLHDQGAVNNPALQQYLNRLSSLLFVLELAENKAAGRPTTFARQNPEDREP